MNQHRLISSKALVAELYSDFNITMDDWVNKANRHMARGLGIMEIDGYYELTAFNAAVTNFMAPLPCDEKHIIGVLCGEKNQMTRLPLTRDLRLGNKFQDKPHHTSYKGAINTSYLRTNFNEGRVTYVYYRIPTDEEGCLLIPDNDKVLEALPFFIIYKLSLGGYKHPLITFEMAMEMWGLKYPQAKNSMNYPSLEDMQRFTQINTNPLFDYILEMDNDFSNNIQDVSSFAQNLNIL